MNLWNEELVSRIYEELSKFNSKISNKSIRTWANNMRYFTKKDIQMANKQMKRCSTSYVIREVQIKITMRYHYTPISLGQNPKH